MSDAITLKTALTLHEGGPRVVPNFAIGALDAWATALMDDLGCGSEDEFHEFLGTDEGKNLLRLTYLFAGRLALKRASA